MFLFQLMTKYLWHICSRDQHHTNYDSLWIEWKANILFTIPCNWLEINSVILLCYNSFIFTGYGYVLISFAFPFLLFYWSVKCLNLGRCIIYMPRIDLWAVDKVHSQTEDTMLNMDTSDLASSTTNHTRKCSEIWNALVEQMDSLLASVSISVLVRLIYTIHTTCFFVAFCAWTRSLPFL